MFQRSFIPVPFFLRICKGFPACVGLIAASRWIAALCLAFVATAEVRAADLTDAECTKFAKHLEAAIKSNNPAALRGIIDWGAIVDQVCKGLTVDDTDKEKYKTAWSGMVSRKAALCDAVAHGGSYHLLHIKDSNTGKRAVFRLLLGNQGANYHELLLARDEKGRNPRQ